MDGGDTRGLVAVALVVVDRGGYNRWMESTFTQLDHHVAWLRESHASSLRYLVTQLARAVIHVAGVAARRAVAPRKPVPQALDYQRPVRKPRCRRGS